MLPGAPEDTSTPPLKPPSRPEAGKPVALALFIIPLLSLFLAHWCVYFAFDYLNFLFMFHILLLLLLLFRVSGAGLEGGVVCISKQELKKSLTINKHLNSLDDRSFILTRTFGRRQKKISTIWQPGKNSFLFPRQHGLTHNASGGAVLRKSSHWEGCPSLFKIPA